MFTKDAHTTAFYTDKIDKYVHTNTNTIARTHTKHIRHMTEHMHSFIDHKHLRARENTNSAARITAYTIHTLTNTVGKNMDVFKDPHTAAQLFRENCLHKYIYLHKVLICHHKLKKGSMQMSSQVLHNFNVFTRLLKSSLGTPKMRGVLTRQSIVFANSSQLFVITRPHNS